MNTLLQQPINESALLTNLNELAQEFIRELSMACRKVSVYGSSHPMAQKAVEKPFFMLDKIFRFKNNVNLNIYEGLLYVLNINLKKSVFSEEITRYMLILDAEAVLFDRRITMTEFGRFIARFIKRVSLSDHANLLGVYLEKNNIETIEVNSEKAFRLFESHKKYRGDIYRDLSVRNIALQQLGDNLELLAEINSCGQTILGEHNIDFRLDIIKYLLPEKITSFSQQSIVEALVRLARQVNTAKEGEKRESLLHSYKSVYNLVDYHPDREVIITALEKHLSGDELHADIARQLSTPVGAIRVESSEQIDNLLKQAFLSGDEDYDVNEYGNTFQRLLKTGQRGKAVSVIDHLLESLSSSEAGVRQKALNLTLCSLRLLNMDTDASVFESAIDRVIDVLSKKRETYEYSEVIWQLVEKCLLTRRFDLMARLTKAMASRRRIVDSVTVYESMTVKKAFESISRREIIDTLIDEMLRADHESARYIREILIATGSDQVAVALSHIISHPVRQIRQQTLKVLAELGKASLRVFSQILMDDAMFARESDRHELPDSKWYVIRNSIFVLGSLRDPEGISPLRLRIIDSDIRVRREIVSALEKIGGEEACDLLILMADDTDKEIRDCAVIALGLVGTPDVVPLLVDTARSNPSVAVRAVTALGRIGGEEARSYLVSLLEDDRKLSELAGGQVSKVELQLAAVKSLGTIADEQSIATIKRYKDSLSATQKIFFKSSPINKAITEILSRH